MSDTKDRWDAICFASCAIAFFFCVAWFGRGCAESGIRADIARYKHDIAITELERRVKELETQKKEEIK